MEWEYTAIDRQNKYGNKKEKIFSLQKGKNGDINVRMKKHLEQRVG